MVPVRVGEELPRSRKFGETWGTPVSVGYMVFFGFSALDCLATIMSLILS
jgi:hypothetical protein